jgi:CheY-like chemotaxis protein
VKTILVVDDEFAIVWSVGTQLQDEGYRVVPAANGREALARIAAGRPDLVITDVMMPIMDGRELIAALGAEAGTRDLPVLVMSAISRGAIDAAGPLRCDAFLRKPFSLKELMREVHRLIGPGQAPAPPAPEATP